ncbi:dolichyl-diphosphooligosaccharide--protein glycosyltransferase subunit 1, partial [Spiromyces aspiralis]
MAVVTFSITALSVPNEDGLINTNVLREVSFESPSVVRETVGIVVLNSHGTKPAERYLVPVRKSMHDKLGYLRASERKSKTPLDVLRADYDEKEGIQYYEVRLTNPLQPGEKISINVQYAFVRALKASPARTSMFDEPSWIWIGNAYADLAYPTKKVKTVILALASEDGKASVREYSKRPEPVSHERAGHIVYGPYKDIQPMQSEEISVRISSAQPNIRAYSHRREIHISHWGNNLNVLEHYHLHNDAPELDGPFDKVGQQLATMQMKPHNAILGLPVRLPLLAHNLYFVDEIGNVSTSAVHLTPDRLTRFMRLSPRYPLLGGWNYTWWHSYDIPLDSVLRWDPVDGRYSLKVPFFAGILDASVDDFELQIVLPEGATDASVILPFEVDERSKRS